MSQRIITEDFFKDSFIASKDAYGKYLYLYLISTKENNICGFAEISISFISFETGIPQDTVSALLKSFQEDGKIVYDNGFLFVKSMALKQNTHKIKYGKDHVNKIAARYSNHRNNIAYQTFLLKMKELNLLKEEFHNLIEGIPSQTLPEGFEIPKERDTKLITNNNELKTNNIKLKGESEGDFSSLFKNQNKKHEIQAFIDKNCPNVSKLSSQITYRECEKILEDYRIDIASVFSVLESMENYKDLRKNYNSVYITLKKWIENNERWLHSSKSSNSNNKLKPYGDEHEQPEWYRKEMQKPLYSV